MRVLVVEDDPLLLDGLTVGLGLAGVTVDVVSTCADAEAALAANAFDAVVLDRMLPDGSGLDVLKRLRGSGDRTPILLLTALDDTTDRVDGLDAGADDYLGKPFDLDELAARLRAIIRRAQGRAESRPQWRGVTLDPARMSAERDGRTVPLSRREFTILQALMDNPGTIQSKTALEQKLYGWQEDVESNTVEVHVHKIRAKLGPDLIETVRGVGYRLKDDTP